MTRTEVLKDFQAKMQELFPNENIEDRLFTALKICLSKKKPLSFLETVPNFGVPHYITLLRKDLDFSLFEISILVNSFYDFTYSDFEQWGYSLDEYEELYGELIRVVAKWEEISGPYRKEFNQKLKFLSDLK